MLKIFHSRKKIEMKEKHASWTFHSFMKYEIEMKQKSCKIFTRGQAGKHKLKCSSKFFISGGKNSVCFFTLIGLLKFDTLNLRGETLLLRLKQFDTCPKKSHCYTPRPRKRRKMGGKVFDAFKISRVFWEIQLNFREM